MLKGNLNDWKNAIRKYCGEAAGEKVKDYKYAYEKSGSIRQTIDVKISGKRTSDGQQTSKVLRFIPYY